MPCMLCAIFFALYDAQVDDTLWTGPPWRLLVSANLPAAWSGAGAIGVTLWVIGSTTVESKQKSLLIGLHGVQTGLVGRLSD